MRRSYTVWPWLSASAVIAVLIGAGTSFAPLYLDNWGGDARHYMCPMIGGHNVDDPRVDAGLCVTPPAWFVIVTALCLLLAVVFAVYCETAMHVDAAGGLHAGGVMTRSARRTRNAMLWTLPAFLVVGLALEILTAAAWLPLVWLVAFFAVWLQAGWHVCDRIGLRLTTRTANDTLAVVWGFGVALVTHALVCWHVTFIGGIRGAALSACCSWAIASVSYNGDAVGEAAAVDRRIATARGVIASIIQWVMVYNAVRAGESASDQTTATWLCPPVLGDRLRRACRQLLARGIETAAVIGGTGIDGCDVAGERLRGDGLPFREAVGVPGAVRRGGVMRGFGVRHRHRCGLIVGSAAAQRRTGSIIRFEMHRIVGFVA